MSGDSPIEMDKLLETFMDNMDIVKQILLSFRTSFETYEEEFHSAQQNNDQELMSRLAHGLKGSAANIRAEKLSAKAAHLQGLIDQEAELGSAGDDVSGDLKKLMQFIDELLAG